MTTELKEFDDLIAALQDERPQIDPGFARELDTRAAAGFSKPRRRWLQFPRISLMAGAPALAFAVIIALVVAASQLPGGSDEADTSGAGSTAASSGEESASSGGDVGIPSGGRPLETALEPQIDALDDATANEYSAPLPPSADSAGAGTVLQSSDARRTSKAAGTARGGALQRGRVTEESAALTLASPADEVSQVADRIFGVVDQIGGFVVSSSVRATDGDGGGGEFQLRIPADRLDDGIAQLSALAHVRERSQGVLDITSERNVSRERLQEARAERVSLLQRLEDATTDAEVDALQAQINNINAAIGSYRADLRRVLRRAQFAVVTVSLVAAGKGETVVPGDKWTPGDALRDAGRVLEVIAGGALVGGAVLIPLLLLGGLALGTRRVTGRRGRERVLDAV